MTHRDDGPRHKPRFNRSTIQFVSKIGRDLFIFGLGSTAFVHELVREGAERSQILIMSAAMMGLPLIIRGDEKRQEAKNGTTKSESD